MKFGYRQELVLQLTGHSINDYDALIELENIITTAIGTIGDVDGHDMGQGVMNIFIRTDNPTMAFRHIKSLLGTKDFMPELKAAYRDVGKDNYTILYPSDLKHFSLA